MQPLDQDLGQQLDPQSRRRVKIGFRIECGLDEEEETFECGSDDLRCRRLYSSRAKDSILEGRTFVLSTIEAPHSTREFSNLQWKQYMRRMTFHAAQTYNICTEGQLDSQMLNANEFEWLKLYHYISTTTELVRCKGCPVKEVLAMLTLGAGDTVPGDIRNNLKKLGNQILANSSSRDLGQCNGTNLGGR